MPAVRPAPVKASSPVAGSIVTSVQPSTVPSSTATTSRCAPSGASAGTTTVIVPSAATVAVPISCGVDDSQTATRCPACCVPK